MSPRHLLFIVGTGIVGMVLKDVVWARIEAAVGEHLCSDVIVVDEGKGGKRVFVVKGGIQWGRWIGHVRGGGGEPVGDGVINEGRGREATKGAGEYASRAGDALEHDHSNLESILSPIQTHSDCHRWNSMHK